MTEQSPTCRSFLVSDGFLYHRMRDGLAFAVAKAKEKGLEILVVLNNWRHLERTIMIGKVLPFEVREAFAQRRRSAIDGVTASFTTARIIKAQGWPLENAVVLAFHLDE